MDLPAALSRRTVVRVLLICRSAGFGADQIEFELVEEALPEFPIEWD